MGAMMSPWEMYKVNGQLNPHYGRAKVRDWKSMMEWITPKRNSGWNPGEEEKNEDGTTTDRAIHIKHRRRCIAWLLNSLARGITFDKKKAETYSKWRYEFAREVQGWTASKTTQRDIAVREAVNSMTLGSLTKRQIPPDNIICLYQ